MLFLQQHHAVFTGTALLIPSHFSNPIVLRSQKLRKKCIRGVTINALSNPASLHLDYFPSLSSSCGRKLTDVGIERQLKNNFLDKEYFVRVFEIAALRVPAAECHALENRLKGHLLNWPRLKNIARVPGDDMDASFKTLLGVSEKHTKASYSDTEINSSLLHRTRIIEKFDSRGFTKFRKLAQISRPKKDKELAKSRYAVKDSEIKNAGNSLERRRRRRDVLVEVVEENGEDDDLRGLLGEEFGVKNWRGPTRLLLLDQRYARKPISELPQAVQVLLRGEMSHHKTLKLELIQCKLTLFYDYWQMHEILEELLPKGMTIPSSFETVGHIAHLNLRSEHLPYRRLIAQVVFDKNRPRIQTVVNKTDAIHNDFRTMQLEVLAGNHSLVTCVVENGLRFHIDLATVYWNSRLAGERQRLIDGFDRSDNVCDVFSGVGPISIAAAKKVNRVYANDLNPTAVKYQLKNIVSNKVQNKIEVHNMDGREFIRKIFGQEKPVYITQVVMNLPTEAAEFLDSFRGVFHEQNTHVPLPKLYVYGFSKAASPEEEFLERIVIAIGETPSDVEMHRVRVVAPGKWMLCATFTLPKTVAFRKK